MKKKVVTVPEFDKNEIIRMLYPPVEKRDEKE